jgi:hypothetical protein
VFNFTAQPNKMPVFISKRSVWVMWGVMWVLRWCEMGGGLWFVLVSMMWIQCRSGSDCCWVVYEWLVMSENSCSGQWEL